MRHPLASRAAVAALVLFMAGAGVAAAADRVKVVARTATIRAEASPTSRALAVVAAGTVLDVLAREGGWLKVSVPAGGNRAQRPGYIEQSQVVPTTERAALVTPGPGGQPGRQQPGRAAARRSSTRVRVFGEGAVQAFRASESFKAIFDSSVGLFYGGGIEVTFGPNLFIQGGATHFQKTGERAFVDNGETFRLGIADTVKITPVTVNLGYRVPVSKKVLAYVGGGAGAVFYSEKADFAQPGDDLSKTGPAFQVFGGVELPVARLLAIAVEGQYQSVRNVLGKTGVSEALGENDLGGASLRVKILIGK